MTAMLSKIQFKQAFIVLIGTLVLSSCTQSVPGEFRLKPTGQDGDTGQTVTNEVMKIHGAPVDMLWVIDNSTSMKTSQLTLKNGIEKFAKRFLKEGTDIQVGVITTDAFLASDLWQKWLVTPQKNRKSPKDQHPTWGPEMAKLTSRTFMRTKGMTSMARLISQFENEVMVGTKGHSEERAFDSVTQFLSDNETDESKYRLFRPGSQRIIVFLGDEDDQTIDRSRAGPEPRTLVYGDNYYTGKDPQIAAKKLPAHATIDCPSQTFLGEVCAEEVKPGEKCEKFEIGEIKLAPKSMCPRQEMLQPVESFKAELDQFFRTIDSSTGAPNYMVVAITAKELETVKKLRKNSTRDVLYERADRILKLVDVVGNGSFSMDIGIQDYSQILEKIGFFLEERSVQQVYRPRTKFTIQRLPMKGELFVVTLISANGAATELTEGQYVLTGNVLEIVDEAVIAGLKDGDRINIRYQPSTVHPVGAPAPTPSASAARLLSTR